MFGENLKENIAFLQRLNATSELQDLLMRTLQAACAFTKSTEGRILLYDNNENSLTVFAEYEAGQLQACHITSAATLYTKFLTEPNAPPHEDTTSEGHYRLVLPLVARRSLVGLLHLERTIPYEASEIELLTGLANYSAIALQNAYLYERATNTNRQLHLLVEASNAVTSSLELDAVLQEITHYMMRALHADWCIISDYDPDTGSLQHLAENREAHWKNGIREDWNISSRTKAIQNSQIYRGHINDIEWADYLTAQGATQVIGVPIQSATRAEGVIEVYTTEPTPFEHQHTGAAVRGAMILAAKFDDLSSNVLNQATRTALAPPENLWCSVIKWNGHSLRRIHTAGYGLRFPRTAFQIKRTPHLAITVDEIRVAELHRGQPQLSEEETRQLEERQMELMVALPLMIKDAVNGLIQVMFADPHHRTKDRDIGLASSIARQAAIALENARLVQDLQHSLERQRSMQAQLVRAARLSVLGELSATLAHQISNPLTIILGDAEMLMEDLENNGDKESAEAIFKAGKRAKQVVERILKMARHEEVPEQQSIHKTLGETLELLSPQINRQGITVEVELQSEEIMVIAAVGQLEDIWSNLLINARDAILAATGRPGFIGISAVEVGDYARITIQDNGTGIPEEKLEGVFNPLYTTKPMGQGTGLGLYVVRQILNNLYGDIHIESNVGKGTTVTITLPLSQMEETGG